jgi:hypothetical protein
MAQRNEGMLLISCVISLDQLKVVGGSDRFVPAGCPGDGRRADELFG